MADIKVVRFAESAIVKFAPDSFYQPLLGDDTGTMPVRTGIQTCQPGYVASMHTHPYIEIIHILEGTAEAWVEGGESNKVRLETGDTIAMPAETAHSFRVVGDKPMRLLGTHVSPKRIVNYRDGRPTDERGYRS